MILICVTTRAPPAFLFNSDQFALKGLALLWQIDCWGGAKWLIAMGAVRRRWPGEYVEDRLPSWLHIESFAALKNKLASVVVAALAVRFFSIVIENTNGADVIM